MVASCVERIGSTSTDTPTTWLGPLDLGSEWAAGLVVRLPATVTAFEHPGPVHLRVGQPPQRSELYRYEAATLVHITDDRHALSPTQLVDWHVSERWVFPCGGGSVTVGHQWQRPPRLVAHATDQARPIYVQRG